ncbi:hypothetical protein GMDG_08484 [Pseudogymnoascus destructans 20631-21]|uniref:Uncharacterized protein n=1 Tax=Pseudogymnoascus destructans (strain ATCC MYA-4855 / 20631-21) TaxID=658429 RepID=L8G447_PSED2|nr:hypothetical protein GMDG_08484 [Pseudogymnoascus destructans 20631-21]
MFEEGNYDENGAESGMREWGLSTTRTTNRRSSTMLRPYLSKPVSISFLTQSVLIEENTRYTQPCCCSTLPVRENWGADGHSTWPYVQTLTDRLWPTHVDRTMNNVVFKWPTLDTI